MNDFLFYFSNTSNMLIPNMTQQCCIHTHKVRGVLTGHTSHCGTTLERTGIGFKAVLFKSN